MIFRGFLIFSLLISYGFAWAMELRGVKMPDELTVEGKKLSLNGMGLRDVSVLGVSIRVYVGGLYLEKKSDNENDIIKSPAVKEVKMQFLRKVSGNDLKKTWQKGIDENCKDKCKVIKEKVDAFKNLMTDVKTDDVMDYTFNSKGFEVSLNGKKLGFIDSPDLAQVILVNWLGDKPVSGDLKRGMLGKK